MSCKLTTVVVKRKRRTVIVCTVKDVKTAKRVGLQLTRSGKVVARGSAAAKRGRAAVTLGALPKGRYGVTVTTSEAVVRATVKVKGR
ncbi:MAG TPA: hypothetical protein VF640_04595 [Acidimicrobiales bacterium]